MTQKNRQGLPTGFLNKVHKQRIDYAQKINIFRE